jgi:hypothetical protein
MLFPRAILREENNPEPTGGGPSDQKPALSADEIRQLVATTANAAVSSHLKRELPKAIGEGLKGLNWRDTLAPVLSELAPQPDPNKPPAPDPNKPDPRLSALEEKYKGLEAQYNAERQAREAAELKARDDRAFSQLRSALQGSDPNAPLVRAEALDAAAKLLFHADRRVVFGEQGEPLFVVRKQPFAGAAEEDMQLPLLDGVQHWLKTPEGKFFAPAPVPPPGQTGNRGPSYHRPASSNGGIPTYDKPAGTDAEKARRALEAEQAIRQQYPDHFRQ